MSKWGKEGVLKLLFCPLCQQSPCPIQQESYLFPSHNFPVPVAAHLVVLNSPCQIEFQVSFDIPSPVSACSGSVHISCDSFLCLFYQEFLAHPCRPPACSVCLSALLGTVLELGGGHHGPICSPGPLSHRSLPWEQQDP